MPNHVRNTITVSGPAELLKLIDAAVGSERTPFDFNRIVPKPAIVDLVCEGALSSTTEAAHPHRNWLEWCNAHWDTKWNAYDFEEGCGGRYTFFTAWAPPIPVVETLSWLFPEVEIRLHFDEPGLELCGRYTYKSGKLI